MITQKTSGTNFEVWGALLQRKKNPPATDMHSEDIVFSKLMSDALCCGTDEILQEHISFRGYLASIVRSEALCCGEDFLCIRTCIFISHLA